MFTHQAGREQVGLPVGKSTGKQGLPLDCRTLEPAHHGGRFGDAHQRRKWEHILMLQFHLRGLSRVLEGAWAPWALSCSTRSSVTAT